MATATNIREALDELVDAVYDERDHHPTKTWLALRKAERALVETE